MNSEIFDFIKIKPIVSFLRMSPARFTQKLHHYKVRGLQQDFTQEERRKIKQSLLVIAALIKEEADKIPCEPCSK